MPEHARPICWHTHAVKSDGEHEHLPLEGHTVTWLGAGDTREDLTFRFENEGWTVDGLVTNPTTSHDDVQYVIRLSASWQVQQVLIFRDLDEPDLWLANDGTGRWGEMNGSVRRELGGCSDVDVLRSAFTRTMAVRRLRLAPGHSQSVESVVVDPETLDVTRARLTYTRLDNRLWVVERDDDRATHEFEVDEFGLALHLPPHFTRS